MRNTIIAVVSVSALVSTGCVGLIGKGIGSISDSRQAKKEEAESFQQLNDQYRQLARASSTLPRDMEQLEAIKHEWSSLKIQIDGYRKRDYFGSQRIGSCAEDAKRKQSDHCKEALALRAKVGRKIAAVLHAAIDAEPVASSLFPLEDIIYAQGDPEIAAAVDVEASLTRLVPKWNDYYAKRLKKVGGAETLARKANRGVCFFSNAAQGANVVPRFALSRSADELHVRCVTPQPIASYERTQQDALQIYTSSAPLDEREVESLPGNSRAQGQSFDGQIPMSRMRKKGAHHGWRFVLAEVRYVTFKKVGERAERTGGDVRIHDQISREELASGFTVIDMEADAFQASDEATVIAAASNDDEADASDEPAPKTKKRRTKTARVAKRNKRTKARP
jgi:hypothetical protein